MGVLRRIRERCRDWTSVAGLGEPYRWITRYVAGDKVHCIHEAASAEVIERHSREAGFPANKVTAIIGPDTAGSGAP